jgi:tRNA dimethylallyltransferase
VSGVRALALCGPTASGKSEFASRLAAEFDGEIVNADSRQVYEGMRIGTGWPTDEQFGRAPHHLYGIVRAGERYSAGRFVDDATRAIDGIRARGRLPIVVGGTGLYVEALAGSMPLDRPVASEPLRARVRHEAAVHPHDTLREWLAAIAPEAAERIEPGDRYRTLRGLEAALAARDTARGADVRELRAAVALDLVVLEADVAELAERITGRVAAMFAAGLVDEALAIRARFGAAPALSGIGYAEALAFADGLATAGEARALAAARTRAYAKRQQTWFRRLPEALRLDAFGAATWDALRAKAREYPAAN